MTSPCRPASRRALGRLARARVAVALLAFAGACAWGSGRPASRATRPASLPTGDVTIVVETTTAPSVPAAPTAPGGAASANAPELPLADSVTAESLLVDVRALAPGVLVDLRYRDAGNFTGAPLPGYEANRAMLRREAAAALARVERRLAAEGLTLLVWDAYRPVRATLAMVEWTRRAGREDLLRDGYIASRSRHNLGVAIDLTLADRATGRPVEMGTAFDTFAPTAHTANATGPVAANRARLVAAMAAEGFANYDQEWWHYIYTVERPLRFDVPIR